MGDFTEQTDEELIARIRDPQVRNREEITDYLMAKYKPLVRGLANEFYIIGGETEDLIQEGMIGLFKAVRDYEKGKEASFSSFANLCVRRQIYTAMEASNRKKHTPLNTYISFSSEEGEDQTVLEEHILNGASASPEQLVIEQEFWEEFYRELWKKLSKMEQQVLTLYREGRTYTEIAEVMHKEPKTIDNALQRIRKKVRLWNSQESARTQFGV